MRKYLIVFVTFFTVQSLLSQEFYFLTGENFTQYDYKNSSGEENENIKSGNGIFFEIGYAFNLKMNGLRYSIGLSLDSYNATGGNTFDNYDWHTKYLGVQNTLSYAFINKDDYQLMLNGGVNLSTIIYGAQKIGGTTYDLKSEDEFSGLFMTPKIGLQARYNIWQSYLSLGYSFSKSLNVTNSSDEKLSFNTHQLQFGIHFFIR